jgi:hypothetical protein
MTLNLLNSFKIVKLVVYKSLKHVEKNLGNSYLWFLSEKKIIENLTKIVCDKLDNRDDKGRKNEKKKVDHCQ